jgi:hypothetical protein
MKPQFYILDVFGGVELTVHGPFHSEQAFTAASQKVRAAQNPDCDSIFALQLKGQRLTQVPASGEDQPR